MRPLTPMLVALVVVGVAALIVAGITLASLIRHRTILRRAAGDIEEVSAPAATLMQDDEPSRFSRSIGRLLPSSSVQPAIRTRMQRAGVDSVLAAQIYYLLRIASVIVFPLLAWVIVPRDNVPLFLLAVAFGLFVGFIMPMAMLDRMIRIRQETITRSVPDALDLLVVCVEAGISLDAAILRVSRELRFMHPALAEELAVVTRMTNAGATRERALRGLWERTGVPELRSLGSSMVQSEKLGTSIATVLRVSADTLRRKRRQSAERRAKQAPLKMTFPLLLFILPALFIVVLGPAIFIVIQELGRI